MLPYVLGGAGIAFAGAYLYGKSAVKRSPWRFDSIPDQSGKVIIVTGANTGIGFHVTRHLARKKAHVIMACRSEERGKAALADIKKEFPNSNVELRLLDVASKHSVSAFVESFLKDFDRLDVLVNNAGVMQAKTFLSTAWRTPL